MEGCAGSLSDTEYRNLWSSLQQQEAHVCTRQCEFKQVFGNLFLCSTSGQAHVCDQNCQQRIFYDNHHDICRLSRKIFPRHEATMEEVDRKRCNEDDAPMAAGYPSAPSAKRPQPMHVMDAQAQAALLLQQQQQSAHQQQIIPHPHPPPQCFGAGGQWAPHPAQAQGWSAAC